MKIYRMISGVVVVILVFCTACLKNINKMEAITGKEPFLLIKHILFKINDGKTDEVSSFIKYALVSIDDDRFGGQNSGEWRAEQKKKYWDRVTLNNSIIQISKIRENIVGNNFAEVIVKIHYSSGMEKDFRFEMQKSGSSPWKIIIYKKMLRE